MVLYFFAFSINTCKPLSSSSPSVTNIIAFAPSGISAVPSIAKSKAFAIFVPPKGILSTLIDDKKLLAEKISDVIGHCQNAVPAKEIIPILLPLQLTIKLDKIDLALSNLFGLRSCANILFEASITTTTVAAFFDTKTVFAPYCGLANAIIKKNKLTINKKYLIK